MRNHALLSCIVTSREWLTGSSLHYPKYLTVICQRSLNVCRVCMSSYQPVLQIPVVRNVTSKMAAPQTKCHFFGYLIRITRSTTPTSCQVVTCIHIIINSTSRSLQQQQQTKRTQPNNTRKRKNTDSALGV